MIRIHHIIDDGTAPVNRNHINGEIAHPWIRKRRKKKVRYDLLYNRLLMRGKSLELATIQLSPLHYYNETRI